MRTELATIEFNGVIGQINCVYKLADGSHAVLDGADIKGFLVSRLDGGDCSSSWNEKVLFESSIVNGAITKAPVPLEHGDAYRFTNSEQNIVNGIYSEDDHSFISLNVEWAAMYCTNIQPLMAEEK